MSEAIIKRSKAKCCIIYNPLPSSPIKFSTGISTSSNAISVSEALQPNLSSLRQKPLRLLSTKKYAYSLFPPLTCFAATT
jgi:hypothetical protein